MSNFEIRPASREDIDFLVAGNVAMALETEDLELDAETLRRGIEHLFEHPAEGRYLIADLDGAPAASLMLTYEWSDWRNGRFWWIQSVYVAPEARRKGAYNSCSIIWGLW